MAQQTIGIGSAANDGTGDDLRTAGGKINANFTELYGLSSGGNKAVTILVTDPNGDALTTGDGKAYYRIPRILDGWELVAVAAHVTTVSTSGLPTIQVNNVTQAHDMLSTRITIDANEKDSLTAATPAVVNDLNADVAEGDEIRIDVDVAGTGTKGLIVELEFGLTS